MSRHPFSPTAARTSDLSIPSLPTQVRLQQPIQPLWPRQPTARARGGAHQENQRKDDTKDSGTGA